ncbi:hypothetical protein LCGC14_2391560 [marine sediment metagenome]|uniref:Uncharacterized protein n=1 Tax=marine sediment metagenome TaxID=412755 RepID=A0A0F9EAD3_9ZZZZ
MTYNEAYIAVENTISTFSMVPSLEGEEGKTALVILHELEDFADTLDPLAKCEEEERLAEYEEAIQVLARYTVDTITMSREIQVARNHLK